MCIHMHTCAYLHTPECVPMSPVACSAGYANEKLCAAGYTKENIQAKCGLLLNFERNLLPTRVA